MLKLHTGVQKERNPRIYLNVIALQNFPIYINRSSKFSKVYAAFNIILLAFFTLAFFDLYFMFMLCSFNSLHGRYCQ